MVARLTRSTLLPVMLSLDLGLKTEFYGLGLESGGLGLGLVFLGLGLDLIGLV